MVWDKSAANAGFSTADKTWLPVKPPQAARAVSGQDAANHSVLNTYRAALAFRKATPALSLGATRFPKVADPVLAVERRHDDQVVTALYNFSGKAISLTVQGAYDIAGPSTGTKNGDKIDLPPYGYTFAISADALTIA
jgi:alpha-glucosidase